MRYTKKKVPVIDTTGPVVAAAVIAALVLIYVMFGTEKWSPISIGVVAAGTLAVVGMAAGLVSIYILRFIDRREGQ